MSMSNKTYDILKCICFRQPALYILHWLESGDSLMENRL